MRTRTLAVLQLLLIFPAALFMAALVVRNLGPPQDEPAHAAQQIVMWYAARLWTLRVLLFALPCMALGSGWAALRARNNRAPWPVRLVSVTTAASAGILAIVAFHVLAN
jgi:hypothetical protein